MPGRFRVQVEYTDRTRRPGGRFATYATAIEVLAASEPEAVEVAAQMADAIREGIGGMVTSARVVAVERI